MITAFGFLAVAASGLLVGAGVWPYKLMRVYRFEHWLLVGPFLGNIGILWAVVLWGCPRVFQCLSNVPPSDLIMSNLFSIAWGISCILSCTCYVRIGVGLTMALLVGLGIPVGSITTLIFKGSGLFSNAPSLGSKAGLTILCSVAMMLIGVVLVAVAGFGRDRQLSKHYPTAGGFAGGLAMMTISGLLVGCLNFSFVYSQESVLGNLSLIEPGDSATIVVTVQRTEELRDTCRVDADRAIAVKGLGRLVLEGPSAWHAARQIEKQWQATQGAKDVRVRVETGSIPAMLGAIAVPIFSGALLLSGYAAYLLFRNRSWGVFLESGWDLTLCLILGVNSAASNALWGTGTLLLGAIGASIGWGISQSTKVVGSQGLSYFSGEWRGVRGTPRIQMWLAVALLIAGSLIMAYGKTLSGN